MPSCCTQLLGLSIICSHPSICGYWVSCIGGNVRTPAAGQQGNADLEGYVALESVQQDGEITKAKGLTPLMAAKLANVIGEGIGSNFIPQQVTRSDEQFTCILLPCVVSACLQLHTHTQLHAVCLTTLACC